MPTVHANGIDIYHELAGSGERLFFISGTGGDLRNKPNVFDSPLGSSRQVLACDQRGLGRSGKPDCEYSMADYANDAAALLDMLDWDRVAVMGVSFGGMVAQELALLHPQKVERLVLACTSAGGAGGASFPLQTLEGLEPRDRAERHLALADMRRDAQWREENPERWQRYVELSLAGRRADRDLAGAQRQLLARAGHDTFSRLKTLEVPVLLAGGRYDGVAPMANMEAMAAQIAGSQLRFFEGGHMFLVQDKAAYPYIIQWLSE